MAETPRSFQDIVRRRQRAGFVGREGELAFFLGNLALSPDDEARRFVFSIHGNGGVGKTFLLTRLRHAATERKWITAGTDESSYDVVEVMTAIAQDLERQGVSMKRFNQRHSAYRQRRHELETEVAPEEGMASFATKAAVRVALDTATASIPGGSIVAKAVDSAAVADNVDRLRTGALQKRYKRDDVRLLTSPEEELTPLFLEGLYQIRRPLALFFDTYERSSSYLDSWLRDVLTGRYGDAPPDMIITVAGRHPLDASRWADFFGVLSDMPLAAFTDVEARQVLANKGIVDEQVIEVILAVSGGLPLAVAMLAEQGPTAPEALHDPSGSLVERFLQWEDDPARRALALAAALPRHVSRDLMTALLPDETTDSADLYGWLYGQSFVTQTVSGCRYHDLVREPMIRLNRVRSRQEWQKTHRRLADTYLEWREELDRPDEDESNDETWQNYLLEECYHRLCADQTAAIPEVMDLVIGSRKDGPKSVRRWVDMVVQVGRDADVPALATWGRRLQTVLDAENGDLSAFIDDLLRQPWLPSEVQKHAYRIRGHQHYLANRYAEAIADLTTAIGFDPDYVWAIAWRGESYRMIERHEEALMDFSATIDISPEHAWAIASRGQTYHAMERYDEALTDLTTAINLNPNLDWAITWRGSTYQNMERYDEALTDLTTAINIDPKYELAIALRGLTYQLMERYDEALTDFTTAIDIDPKYELAIALRGETYRLTERYDEALTDFTTAIDIDPKYARAIASRGETYRLMGRHNEALTDFTTAIDIDPTYDWAIISRGLTYQLMERYDEALTDFTTTINIDPKYTRAIASRGETYRLMGRHNEALTDFTTTIDIDPKYDWAFASRGQTYHAMERYDEALTDFTTAIDIDPTSAWVITSRGHTYRLMGRCDEALTDHSTAIAINPTSAWAIASRGYTYRLIGRYEEAVTDLTVAIDIDPTYEWAIISRGQIYRLMGRYDEALTDFTTATTTDPTSAWAIASRGHTYRLMERYEEAVTDFTAAIDIDPTFTWAITLRGRTYWLMERYDEALTDHTSAITIDPKYDWAIASRGEIYRLMGRHNEALTDYTTAIGIDPNYPLYRLFQGMLQDDTAVDGEHHQWVADVETSMIDSESTARSAIDWLISEGIISPEKTATDVYSASTKITGKSAVSPDGHISRLTVHRRRVICYPMKADILICPNCNGRSPLRKDGIPTQTWDEMIHLANRWSSGCLDQRKCTNCDASTRTQDWQLDQPWVFCHFALCLWNWESLDLTFVDRLSEHLGRRLVHVRPR